MEVLNFEAGSYWNEFMTASLLRSPWTVGKWSNRQLQSAAKFQTAHLESPMLVVPLEMMSTGEQGRISALDGSPEFVVRLEEMGLREGVLVRMVRSGSPCILAVNDHRLSLRIDDCATVLVEVIR